MKNVLRYLPHLLALARGWAWRARSNVQATGTPRIIGPRARLMVAEGGLLRMGIGCEFDRDVEIVVYKGGRLELGDHVYVGHGSTIACADSIRIGSNTLVGDLVSIRDMNHKRIAGMPLRLSGIETRPITIGSNCWLASKVTVAAGSELADEVTVAANAAVSGKFPPGALIGGVPARAIVSAEGSRD